MPDKLTDSKVIEGTTDIDYEGTLKNLTIQYYDALDLINRLQAENEKERECVLHLTEDLKQAVNRNITAKTEAYKEFAELVHCHCESVINHEWNKKVAPVSWADAYEQFDDEVDYFLKELVGDNDES